MDLSFLKLYDNIGDALNDTRFKAGQFFYNLPIQLLPNESYLQITNNDGGISLDTEFFAFIVDCNGNQLANITDNIFIEEFTDYNGNTQCKIEIINLGLDFHGKAVIIKFDLFNTDTAYYTRPILITAKNKNRTYRFDYTNPTTISGIDYTNADCYQAIRLLCKFKGYDNSSEINDYYEISTGNTVSYRPLRKVKERFGIETIDDFTFIRLQELLFHNVIYLDGKRITNKPLLEPNDPFGESNIFSSEFVADIDEGDTFSYTPQIYSGFNYVSFNPNNGIVNCDGFTALTIGFNIPITIESGTVTVFNESGTIIDTFTETDMTLQGVDVLSINVVGSAFENPTNGSYYINVSGGLVKSIYDEQNTAILDNTTWVILLQGGDYSIDDYSITDYLTGCPPLPNPLVDDLVLFYKFNELTGTTAVDDSTLGNDGTITNALIKQTGLIDKCYYFNSGGATDEYVKIPDADSLSFGGGAFSIEVWLNSDANFGRILNKYNETTGDLEYRLFAQSGVLQFSIYTDASNRIAIADNVTFTTGVWQQIFITYDGSGDASGLTMKVDDVTASFASSETGVFTGMQNTAQPVILGQQADDLTGLNRYSGKMDILRIWKGYVVTDTEKTTLYNSGNGTETL